MPSCNPLQQLDLLNRSSSELQDQLSNILYGKEYQQCVPNLQGDDLVWLVEYLDKVVVALLSLIIYLSQCRFSIVLTRQVLVSGSVYANLEEYVVRR